MPQVPTCSICKKNPSVTALMFFAESRGQKPAVKSKAVTLQFCVDCEARNLSEQAESRIGEMAQFTIAELGKRKARAVCTQS